jgi:hypothetical protein
MKELKDLVAGDKVVVYDECNNRRIAIMYVDIRICRYVWFAHEWLLVFAIGLCFVLMAIKQLMEV